MHAKGPHEKWKFQRFKELGKVERPAEARRAGKFYTRGKNRHTENTLR